MRFTELRRRHAAGQVYLRTRRNELLAVLLLAARKRTRFTTSREITPRRTVSPPLTPNSSSIYLSLSLSLCLCVCLSVCRCAWKTNFRSLSSRWQKSTFLSIALPSAARVVSSLGTTCPKHTQHNYSDRLSTLKHVVIILTSLQHFRYMSTVPQSTRDPDICPWMDAPPPPTGRFPCLPLLKRTKPVHSVSVCSALLIVKVIFVTTLFYVFFLPFWWIKMITVSIYGRLWSIFTALHGMQSRYSDGNSVYLSVCLSVCLSVRRPSVKRVHCDKTEEKSVQIFIPCERSFSLVLWEEEWLVGRPLIPEILGQLACVGAKSPILNQ